MPRILVLVLSVDSEPWRGIELEGQRRTWASADAVPAGCKVVFYYGTLGIRRWFARVAGRLQRTEGSSAPRRLLRRIGMSTVAAISVFSLRKPAVRRGDRLWTDVPETYWFTLPKTVSALRWATVAGEPRFDYVYRTNASSYIRLRTLQEVANEMPRTGCYAGFLGRHPLTECSFVSGSGALMSWDVASEVGTCRTWDWGVVDDVAMGEHMNAIGIRPLALPRVTLADPSAAESLTDEGLRGNFHFRCKSGEGLRADAAVMHTLHARLVGIGGGPAGA